jgi:hypothetical protein
MIAVRGERTIAARILVGPEALEWMDKGGLRHRVHWSRIKKVHKLRFQPESVILFTADTGKESGIGVGPEVAKRVSEAIAEHQWGRIG